MIYPAYIFLCAVSEQAISPRLIGCSLVETFDTGGKVGEEFLLVRNAQLIQLRRVVIRIVLVAGSTDVESAGFTELELQRIVVGNREADESEASPLACNGGHGADFGTCQGDRNARERIAF